MLFVLELLILMGIRFRVGDSLESALSALEANFLALSAYFDNFRQKIPNLTCHDKRESYLIVLQQNNV